MSSLMPLFISYANVILAVHNMKSFLHLFCHKEWSCDPRWTEYKVQEKMQVAFVIYSWTQVQGESGKLTEYL